MIQIAHNGDQPYAMTNLSVLWVTPTDLARIITSWTLMFGIHSQVKDPLTNITAYIFNHGRAINVQH